MPARRGAKLRPSQLLAFRDAWSPHVLCNDNLVVHRVNRGRRALSVKNVRVKRLAGKHK